MGSATPHVTISMEIQAPAGDEKRALLPPTTPRPPLRGLGLVALSAVCFSVVTTLVKYETQRGFSAMDAVFWRSAGALALNWVAMTTHGVSSRVPSRDRHALLLQCVFGFACIAFGFFAISHMVLADASVLIFTSPVLTFFLGACLLEEHVDPVGLGCALFSGVGVVCVLRPAAIFGSSGGEMAASAPIIAVVAAILSAVSQALLYICVRRLQSVHSLVVAHYYAVFSACAAMSFILVFQSSFTWPSTPPLWAAAIGTGVFAFIGQVALTKGFQLETAGIASVMRYLDVVCVFVWDTAFLYEPVSPWSVIGALIVCASAVASALHKAEYI